MFSLHSICYFLCFVFHSGLSLGKRNVRSFFRRPFVVRAPLSRIENAYGQVTLHKLDNRERCFSGIYMKEQGLMSRNSSSTQQFLRDLWVWITSGLTTCSQISEKSEGKYRYIYKLVL